MNYDFTALTSDGVTTKGTLEYPEPSLEEEQLRNHIYKRLLEDTISEEVIYQAYEEFLHNTEKMK